MVHQTNESSKTFREQQDILQQESSRAIITQVDEDKVSLSSKRLSRKKNTPAETRASLDDAQSLSSSTNLFTNPENARNQRTPIVLRPKSASGNVLGKLYWWRTHALSLELDNALLKKDAAAVRKALERGARVNKTISLSENPTAYVCRQGNAEILEALLQYGADPDVPCGLIVAEHGFVECLVVLYSRRTWVSADLARIFDHALACGQSGVMDYLASLKNDSVLRHIESKASELYKDNDLSTLKALVSLEQVFNPAQFRAYEHSNASLLQAAIVENKTDFVEILLRHSSAPRQVLYEGDQNLLSLAASNGEITKLLLDHGFDPNIRSRDLRAPIHHAARSGNTGVMDMLLQAKADIDSRDNYGATALLIAASNKDSLAMEFLLARGANASVVTLNRSNIVHYAAMSGQSANVTLALKHFSQVEDGSADVLTPRTANNKGWSPAAIALQLRHWEVIEMILRSGVSSKPLNVFTDLSLLHLAAARLDDKAVQLVLSHGAEANDTMGFSSGETCSAMCMFTARTYSNFEPTRVKQCKQVLTRFGATSCLHEEHKFSHEGSREIREFCENVSKINGVIDWMR